MKTCNYCGHDTMDHHGTVIIDADEPTFCRNVDCSCPMWNQGDVTLRNDLDRIIDKRIVQPMYKDKHYTYGDHHKVLDELELVIAQSYKHNYRTEKK